MTTWNVMNESAAKSRRPGSRGATRMPSAGDVLLTAIEFVLTGAGIPEAAASPSRQATGTGFVTARMAGTRHPRVSVTWYEDGARADSFEGAAGELRDCERALRRAGFQVDYVTEDSTGCLLVWR